MDRRRVSATTSVGLAEYLLSHSLTLHSATRCCAGLFSIPKSCASRCPWWPSFERSSTGISSQETQLRWQGQRGKAQTSSASRGRLQHVPLLLVSNLHGEFEALHLEHYSINYFEPLHAIKGHLVNLFAELPPLLPSPNKQETEQLLSACLQKKKTTGANLRATAIVLRQFLTGQLSTEKHVTWLTFF